MADFLPEPQFPLSVDAKIALAAIERLREPRWHLEAYFQDIQPAELDAVFRGAKGGPGWAHPHLAVVIDTVDEARHATGRTNQLTVGLLLLMIDQLANDADPSTDAYLRSRVLDMCKRALSADAGCLTYEGERLTAGLLRWQRLPQPTVLRDTYLATTARVEFETRIHEQERTLL